MVQPDLTFEGQRQALAQAAEQSAANNDLSLVMSSAQGLMRDSQQMGRNAIPERARPTGITVELVEALRNNDTAEVNRLLSTMKGDISRFGEENADMAKSFGSHNGSALQGERATYLRNGLVQRGFSPEEAEAFVINMQDESNLKSDIVEGAPNVHGTRGQGLYQLTDISPGKGRRTDYLNFMKQLGRDDLWSDDSQLDFAWWERNNTEKANWDRVAGISGVGNKAAGIARYVLRPAQKHLEERSARYAQLGY